MNFLAICQSAGVVGFSVLVFWLLCRLEVHVERKRGRTQVPIEPLGWEHEG